MPVSDIPLCLSKLRERHDDNKLFRDYFDGDHSLLFATEKFRNAFGNLFAAFADNICPTVVQAVTDRLTIHAFTGVAAKDADKLWKKNRGARMQQQVHREAAKTGDSYVIVWPDADGTTRIWPQRSDECVVVYDKNRPGEIEYAAKAWVVGEGKKKQLRVTLYYKDHIERYISDNYLTNTPSTSSNFKDYSDANDAMQDNPLSSKRVPVFHFGNDADIGSFGTSELQNVVPLQDALNKSMVDMLVAMEFQAYPQRYATGLQIEIDPDTGKPRNPPFTPGVDRLWTAAGDVKFGQFPGADLRAYLEVQNDIRTEVARVSGTPLHFLMLQPHMPSGEALKISEGRLTKKIEDRQVGFGDTWEEVMEYALDADEVDIDWRNAAPLNPLLDAETMLVKEQVGVSMRQALAELGYSPTEIDRMMTENTEALLQQMQATPALASAFTRNGSPGEPSQPAPTSQQQNSQKFGSKMQTWDVGNTGMRPGSEIQPVKPARPRSGVGQYGEA